MDVADQASGSYTDEDIFGVNPMGRFASPDDIAKAILFLADPAQSGFVNGHALVVMAVGPPTPAGRACACVTASESWDPATLARFPAVCE